MPSITIKRKTSKVVDKLIGLKFGKARLKVGFPAGSSEQSEINKAIWNEFGTRGGASGGGWGGPIPERPFLRNTMKINGSEYADVLRSQAWGILTGSVSLEDTLTKLGILARDDIRAEITALMKPPNSPVTVKMKGFNNPLIQHGTMRRAVTYIVQIKGR